MFGNNTTHPRKIVNNQTAISVANWLRGLRNVISAVPVAVQIGHHTYSAGQYTENQNGVEETRLYIVGEMPPFWMKFTALTKWGRV